jgi:hypothetical protein
MAYSQFEPYRKQVEEWKAQGRNKATMLRRLHEEYPEGGCPEKKSSLYPFVDSLGNSSGPDISPLQEDIRQRQATLKASST